MEKKAVNLLQQRGAPPTFWERLYDWVTNTCRMIVIVTEVLVLGAFGWRFWLDRRLTDLKEEIEQKGEILRSLSDQEQEIRLLQTKLGTYKELWTQSSSYTSVMKEVNGYVPAGTEDLTVSITKTEEGRAISITGIVDRDEISNFENSLKDSTNFSKVRLSEIEREGEGENIYSFVLLAELISGEGRPSLTQNEITESTP